jgi:glutaconate CoA-transferase subunit B
VRLPGGGGAAVMLPTAKRVVTWRTEHSPRSLVEKLDFVTAAGNLAALITPIAVFQRRNGRLALESWHPDSSLDAVVKRTGFKFDATGAAPTPAPTQRERDALKALDADGAFEAEAAIKAA